MDSGSYDVIIVGAGIEGSGTAYNLAKNGHKILLLEQFSLPHTRGSSHGQSRIIRKAYTQKCYAEMMNEAYTMWNTLERETDTKLYQKTGLLVVSQPPSEGVNNVEKALKSQNAKFRRLTGQQLRDEFGMMRFDLSCDGLFEDDGGILRADKCLQSLQKMFISYGGTLNDAEPVTSITPGRRVTVTTNQRSYDANSIVITAGPWTTRVTKPLGLNLPLKVEAINVCYFKDKELTAWSKRGAVCFSVYLRNFRSSAYGLPAYDYPGLVKVCVHYGKEVDPDRRDEEAGTADLEDLKTFVSRHLPGLESKPSIIEKCMYTTTPDSDFILDRHPQYSNIVIGAGFSGHGFKMSPVIGKILGELATGQPPSYDLTPFRIARFGNMPIKSSM